MKKSLIWRFVITAVILGAWLYSMFPLKDQEFVTTFETLAAAKVAKLRAAQLQTADQVKALEERLTGIEDKASQAYKNLETELAAANTAAAAAAKPVADYEALTTTAQKLLADNPTLAPYLAYKQAARGDDTQLPIRLNEFITVPTQRNASNNMVLSHVRAKSAGKLRLGLDLRGGTEFIIGFDKDKLPSGREVIDVRDQIIEILRNRVDVMGVVEPEIKPVGPTSISLRMPSVSEDDKADIRRTITEAATLHFYLVHENSDQLAASFRADPKAFKAPSGYTMREVEHERNGEVSTEILFVKSKAEDLKGEQVANAYATFDELGNYAVSLEFDSRGAQRFAAITSANVNRRLAIALDEKVYSAPNIREAITGGRAQISGNFSPEEARRLAGVIESGNLPVNISIDSEFGTDPTLGIDSIKSGTNAAIFGLLAVLVFMIVYYRIAGLIAVSALAANLLLVFGTLTLTGATITLPGIAGVVLTIGMAVDANVLIFERIREELLNGKTIGNALNSGYSRAFITIIDSNLTTLLTALILYKFGTGPVRGFAVTLSMGIVASMFTALFMTRAIFDLLLYKGWLQKLGMATLFKRPNVDFLGVRRLAMGASILLIVLSLGTALIRGGDGLSIDFTGGTEITYRSTSGTLPEVKDIREKLAPTRFSNSRIGYKFSAQQESRLLELVMPESTNQTDFNPDELTGILRAAYPEAKFEHAQTNSVGGLVGAQFQSKAIWAAVLAAIGIILYISFRFEVAYGVAAVIALLHDVIIAGGIYLLCGRQLSLPVLAALLTIMGYSLNDTIVVFDRIREDLTLHKKKTYREIINLSINQTLSRTVLTSLTTLLVVATLFLFGGGAINDFALVMLAGVVVGTYSSIFIASAVVASWHKRAAQIKEA